MQLKRDDWEMIRRIDGVKPSDRLSVDSLYNRLAIEPLSTLLRHVRWCWHVSCIEGWISSHCFSLDVAGKHDKGQSSSYCLENCTNQTPTLTYVSDDYSPTQNLRVCNFYI